MAQNSKKDEKPMNNMKNMMMKKEMNPNETMKKKEEVMKK